MCSQQGLSESLHRTLEKKHFKVGGVLAHTTDKGSTYSGWWTKSPAIDAPMSVS